MTSALPAPIRRIPGTEPGRDSTVSPSRRDWWTLQRGGRVTLSTGDPAACLATRPRSASAGPTRRSPVHRRQSQAPTREIGQIYGRLHLQRQRAEGSRHGKLTSRQLTIITRQARSGAGHPSLLNACIAAGGTDPNLCRRSSGSRWQSRPPQNFLANLGRSRPRARTEVQLAVAAAALRTISTSVVTTRGTVRGVDTLGNVAQRQGRNRSGQQWPSRVIA